jgi:hypothetical protein
MRSQLFLHESSKFESSELSNALRKPSGKETKLWKHRRGRVGRRVVKRNVARHCLDYFYVLSAEPSPCRLTSSGLLAFTASSSYSLRLRPALKATAQTTLDDTWESVASATSRAFLDSLPVGSLAIAPTNFPSEDRRILRRGSRLPGARSQSAESTSANAAFTRRADARGEKGGEHRTRKRVRKRAGDSLERASERS